MALFRNQYGRYDMYALRNKKCKLTLYDHHSSKIFYFKVGRYKISYKYGDDVFTDDVPDNLGERITYNCTVIVDDGNNISFVDHPPTDGLTIRLRLRPTESKDLGEEFEIETDFAYEEHLNS